MHVDKIRMALSILCFKGSHVDLSKLRCISIVKICFNFADEIPHCTGQFISVFTGCQRSCLQKTRMKSVKKLESLYVF